MLVIAPEVFEMRVPRNLLPFVLDEPSESLHSSKQSPLKFPNGKGWKDDTITYKRTLRSSTQLVNNIMCKQYLQ